LKIFPYLGPFPEAHHLALLQKKGIGTVRIEPHQQKPDRIGAEIDKSQDLFPKRLSGIFYSWRTHET